MSQLRSPFLSAASPDPAQGNLFSSLQHLLPGALSSPLSLGAIRCSSLDTGMDYKLFENRDRASDGELPAKMSKPETPQVNIHL